MKKTKTKFASAEELDRLIAQYFEWIEGKYHTVQKETKGVLTDEKVWEREPEPATIAGLHFISGTLVEKSWSNTKPLVIMLIWFNVHTYASWPIMKRNCLSRPPQVQYSP